jgi:hypothetical protein
MKSIVLIVTLIFSMTHFFGQTEDTAYKIVANNFKNHFNESNFEMIFKMFSSEMKSALPLSKTTDLLKRLRTQAGELTKFEFGKHVNGTYASYKTNFERALLAVDISIDGNSKINGLLIKPYADTNFRKTKLRMDNNNNQLLL